jgi:hypothetical protein
MLNEFISYLNDQVGQPYLWGGQHTKLTPENYKSVIARREEKPENRRLVEAFCEKKFAEGETVLYAYDCSGLGVYWLYNFKHLWPGDVNANTMMSRCVDLDTPEPPERGWWVFKLSGKRATHIGYMIDNEYLIEAKGRKYGVVKTKWREGDWSCWGIPKVFEDEIRHPAPPEPSVDKYVLVVGGSVNVRTSDSKKGKILFTAHRGDTLPYIDTAETGWYHVRSAKGEGYITNIERYTKLEG